jgi:hypothetical protein
MYDVPTCLSFYNPALTRTLDQFFTTDSTTSMTVGVYTGGGYARASAVQVRFQSTDFVALSSSSSSEHSTTTVTVTAYPEGLSPAGKVGVGVGVVIGVLLLCTIGVGLVVLRRWRTRSRAEHLQMEYGSSGLPRMHQEELDGAPIANRSQMFEMDSQRSYVDHP